MRYDKYADPDFDVFQSTWEPTKSPEEQRYDEEVARNELLKQKTVVIDGVEVILHEDNE